MRRLVEGEVGDGFEHASSAIRNRDIRWTWDTIPALMNDIARPAAVWFSIPQDKCVTTYERVLTTLKYDTDLVRLVAVARNVNWNDYDDLLGKVAEDITERLMAGEVVDAAVIVDVLLEWLSVRVRADTAVRIAKKVNNGEV